MTLNLELPPELENALIEAAREDGLSVESLALKHLKNFFQDGQKRIEAAKVLQSWIDDSDTTEQQATGAFLLQVLDQDRPIEIKLFPKEIKGITW